MALLCMALADLGVDAGVVHRQPGRHHHRHRPRQGQDPRGAGRPGPRRAGRREGLRGRRLPGRVDRARRSPPSAGAAPTPPPWPWRPRFEADTCEIYTDVHRRVLRRPPPGAAGPQLNRGQLRRDARDRGRRRPGPALRSVEFARNHGVALHVRSSFTWEPGTWVTEEEPTHGAGRSSPAVVHDVVEAKVTVTGVPDRPGIAAALFRAAGRRRHQRRHDRAEHLRGRR